MTLIFCTLMARAEKSSYPEQKLLAKGVEKIQIAGVNGHVKLVGRPGKAYRLKVRHTKNKTSQDWSLSVDRQGTTLVLEVFSVAYGAQWRAHVRKELWPDFDIELEGPAVPAIVSWRDGNLEVFKWAANFEASQVQGQVSIKEGVGSYTLQLGQSEVVIDGLVGNLALKGESGRVRIAQVQGDLNLTWVAGDVELKRISGQGQVDGNNGELRMREVAGRWTINWAKGRALIEQSTGSLKADGDATAWSITRSTLNDVEVKSGSGAVHWLHNRGGAKVFLTSDKGEISRPIFLDGEGRKVSEFTIGKKPLANVFVRTESGPIHFQQ